MVIREYVDEKGNSPFTRWHDRLDSTAAVRVGVALHRLEEGNFSMVKGVGSGVFEYKLHFGPGYRIYFGKDGEQLIILLAGGTKKRQSADISEALARWQNYKQRKR